MQPMIGRQLAHYTIVELLGEGGMGAVYKARDHHLDRFVALKLLRSDKLADADRRRRFIFEAKAASALNHPNIVTIHDIASDDGTDFIAMEYVKGHTLHALGGRRGLPVGDVVKFGIQIADALAAAHAAGIIHRDLKPANVMVAEHGIIKVLDFGLAKLTETEPAAETESTRTQQQAVPATEEGQILGTVSYMAPEQVESKKIDARTDVFAFGTMLYEMLTRRRPFERDTRMGTFSAILKDAPQPMSELSAETPLDLERIILRCLRKEPDRRYQTMRDVKNALEEVREDSESGRLSSRSTGKAEAPKRPPKILLAAAVSLAVTAVAFGLWFWFGRSAAKPVELAMRPLTADTGLTTDPVFSPDGKLVAYASDRATQKNLDIWIHPLTAGGQPVRLTRNDADDSHPDFSPDGGMVAFHSERDGGGIYLVPTFGGEERLLVRGGLYPRFSPDGKSIAYSVGRSYLAPSRVYIIPAGGGTATELASDVPWAGMPVFTPDGRHILFDGAAATNDLTSHDYWVAPVNGGPSIKTGAAAIFGAQQSTRPLQFAIGRSPTDLADGRVLFAASGHIWGLDLAGPNWKATGTARQMASGNSPGSVRAGIGSRLIFVNRQVSGHMWKLKLDHNKGRPSGEIELLSHSGGSQRQPSSSANGRVLAYSQQEPSGGSIRLRDLATGNERTLVSGFGRPKVSPDGSRVGYGLGRSGLFIVPTSGGESELLLPGEERSGSAIYAWTADGKSIVYWSGKPVRFALLNPGTKQSTILMSHPKYDIHGAELSPDQRWVTFKTPIGRREPVWITSFRDGKAGEEKDWIPVSEDAVERLWWSPDGNLLYSASMRDGARCIWAQRLDPVTKRPVGEPFAILHVHGARVKVGAGAAFGPAVVPDGLIFSLDDESGNVWIAERKE